MAVLRSCHDEPWCGFHAFTATCPARPPIAGSAQQGRAPSSTSTTTDPLAVSCPAEQRPVGIALWLQVRAWALSTNGSPTPVTPTRLAESRGDSSTWESGTRRPDRRLSWTPETTRDAATSADRDPLLPAIGRGSAGVHGGSSAQLRRHTERRRTATHRREPGAMVVTIRRLDQHGCGPPLPDRPSLSVRMSSRGMPPPLEDPQAGDSGVGLTGSSTAERHARRRSSGHAVPGGRQPSARASCSPPSVSAATPPPGWARRRRAAAGPRPADAGRRRGRGRVRRRAGPTPPGEGRR